MEDQQIVSLLFARDEAGLYHAKEKYLPLCRKVLQQVLSDEQDVLECTNDVLLALWNSIPPHFPQRLSAYLCTLARRIGINRYKANQCQKRGGGYTRLLQELDNCLDPRQTLPDMDLQRILREFLAQLDGQTRVLFLRRYYYMESVKDLAKLFAVSENYISVRLHRAKRQLRTMLNKEGIEA